MSGGIFYYSNQIDAENDTNLIAANTIDCVVGSFDLGNIGSITRWSIASNSTGTSPQNIIYNNGDSLICDGVYFLYCAIACPALPPPPYSNDCIEPPYNATNFTAANPTVLNTLQDYARNSPNYPWATGSNAQQIYRSNQNISFFNNMNLETKAIKTQNGSSGNIPYRQFKSDAERLMYIQGQALTAARNAITGQNPSAPAGVPCSTIYGIINS
jgi:hypothetical protein